MGGSQKGLRFRGLGFRGLGYFFGGRHKKDYLPLCMVLHKKNDTSSCVGYCPPQ